MTSYFDCSDAEGLDLGDNDVECIHGVDLFVTCVKCKPMAANGGEENDDMEHDPDDTGFNLPLHQYPPMGLVSMRNAIDLELKQRRDALAKELAATEHALNGTKPRARRSDAGRPRQKPANEVARDEKGVAV